MLPEMLLDGSWLLRILAPPAVAVLAVAWLYRSTIGRGLLPAALERDRWRRLTVALLLTGIFWLGVFLPLGLLGTEMATFDPERTSPAQLFLLHGLLLTALVLTFVLSFPGEGVTGFLRRLGFRPTGVVREVGLGLAAGVIAWGAVIGAVLAVVVVIAALGFEDWLPHEPPAAVPWIAGLPLITRLGVSLSAGVVEEAFFRGFLQPRAGVVFSTVCFVLAHLSYQSPFMLVGVALLSIIYGSLVLWRRSVWAAATAHFVFDAVQLLVVIPAALGTC